MRLYPFILAVCVLLPANGWCQKQLYAIPLQNEIPVYENDMRKVYEKPLFTVGQTQCCLIKKIEGDKIQIRNSEGKTGWVEKTLVKIINQNRQFLYSPIAIVDRLDDPGFIWIGEGPDQIENPLILERSFADALRENVDRETIMRQISPVAETGN